MNKKGQPRHGGWTRGKRRNPAPQDWERMRAAISEAVARRQTPLIARNVGVHRDTVLRWRSGHDLPSPNRVRALIDALYALRLYRVRGDR